MITTQRKKGFRAQYFLYFTLFNSINQSWNDVRRLPAVRNPSLAKQLASSPWVHVLLNKYSNLGLETKTTIHYSVGSFSYVLLTDGMFLKL